MMEIVRMQHSDPRMMHVCHSYLLYTSALITDLQFFETMAVVFPGIPLRDMFEIHTLYRRWELHARSIVYHLPEHILQSSHDAIPHSEFLTTSTSEDQDTEEYRSTEEDQSLMFTPDELDLLQSPITEEDFHLS